MIGSEFFSRIYNNAQLLLSQIQLVDLIDLFLVWIVVYRVLILTKRSGAVQILSGMGVLAIAFLLSVWVDLISFHWILERFFSNLFLIVVILFQGEIRRALAQIGSNPFFSGSTLAEETHLMDEVAKGALQLATKGHGALIVIEGEIELDYFVELGTVIDASVKSELFNTIFHPSSPLHDGAVIVRGGRIFAAGCFLPLSKNPVLDRNLGTRHRAAIGLTEETDAFVLVVSEESNSVGVVTGGNLSPDVDLPTLRRKLYDSFGIKYRAVAERREV